MWLCAAYSELVGSTIVFWQSGSRLLGVCGLELLFSRGEVMTMAPVRGLDETLFGEVWTGFLVCAAQRFCDDFCPIFH
jgi:hypothetical protein